MSEQPTRVTVEAIVRADAPVAPEASRLRRSWLVVGLGALAAAFAVSVSLGPAGLPLGGVVTEMVSALPGVDVGEGLSDRHAAILWQMRLPRIVLGALVGGTLALAGAAYQGVFRNPLADPYLLGVAAGAGLGATLAIAYGPDTTSWPVDALPIFAFVGAVLGVALAWGVGHTASSAQSVATLILAGVAIASFLTAIQTYVQQRESETLREVYGWILGRLSTSGWHEVLLVLPYVVVSTIVILLHRRLLDVLSVGDDEAGSLGVRTTLVRLVVIGAATFGTAAVVAVSGLIGFVGIVVPHVVRMVAGSSYRIVLPLSLMLGAAFLVATDLVARTVFSPAELPIGVITAFFGAPFFALVLRTSRRFGL
ncbi:FecCD family ABC transporter permease [Actinomarinicola tropica]|uniref:Iron chelate uptake ABC transporter family permease subunit n=1 Tax=Actinomarinicola tropica TaxID=2789776 RepID=A0A5Q2RP22_9ACTN|nr:iron ABC transporter permease [Actinomarinicola tropica]QGG96176.1 iron chelate uptake ABC transporter family permease subunit [Actinomarinicola tropica]